MPIPVTTRLLGGTTRPGPIGVDRLHPGQTFKGCHEPTVLAFAHLEHHAALSSVGVGGRSSSGSCVQSDCVGSLWRGCDYSSDGCGSGFVRPHDAYVVLLRLYGSCPNSVISVRRAAAAGRSSDRWLQ